MNNTTFSNILRNNDNEGANTDDDMVLIIKPYLLLILFIQGLLSTVGNLVICLMTITMPTLRKKTYVYFILCLSFSDMLFGSSTIDHYFQTRLDYIPPWRCILSLIVSMSAFLISLTQTFLICLERTRHIKHFPHSVSLVSDDNRTTTVLVAWAACVAYICGLVAVASRNCSVDNTTVEDIIVSCPFVTHGLATVFTPLYLGVILQYIFLLYKIKKLQQSICNLRFDPANPGEVAMHNISLKLFKNIFKTLSVFVIMYIVTLCPVLVIILNTLVTGKVDRATFALSMIITNLNSLVSPLLYIWRFKDVRRLFEC